MFPGDRRVVDRRGRLTGDAFASARERGAVRGVANAAVERIATKLATNLESRKSITGVVVGYG